MDMQYLKITSNNCQFIRKTLADNLWTYFEKNADTKFVKYIKRREVFTTVDEAFVRTYILEDEYLSTDYNMLENKDVVNINYPVSYASIYAVIYYDDTEDSVEWCSVDEHELYTYDNDFDI